MLNVNNGDNLRSILKKVALLVFIRKKVKPTKTGLLQL